MTQSLLEEPIQQYTLIPFGTRSQDTPLETLYPIQYDCLDVAQQSCKYDPWVKNQSMQYFRNLYHAGNQEIQCSTLYL